MLHEHRVFHGQPAVVAPYLSHARTVLDRFLRTRRPDGLIGWMEAPFIDWASEFHAGCPPQAADEVRRSSPHCWPRRVVGWPTWSDLRLV